MVGQTLSHYKILSKLGEGGMGEVYLAEDLNLKRQVALKIMPTEAATRPDRLQRFQREAEAIAALDHPNIVTIYNIEEAEGRRIIVMQLVEGESLDTALSSQGLPLAKVFAVAIPLADALAAAHDRGIIHRDLKPANVMVTPEGRVKVLDFGLAKLAAETTGELVADEATEAATRTATLTREGTVMGTAPYMSPEQLKGADIDHRSDIFSLGVLLYEMVTGQRPFQGDSGIDLASRILREAPTAATDLRGDMPRHLARIIHTCLEKNPERRYQSMKDVRNELERLESELDSGVLSGARGIVDSAARAEGAPSPPANHRTSTGVSDDLAASPTATPSSGHPEAASQHPTPPTTAEEGPMPSAAPASDVSAFKENRGLSPWIALAAVAMIGLFAAIWWLAKGESESDRPRASEAPTAGPATPDSASLAVLPFADRSAEQDQEYFSDGLSEELITVLASISKLKVAGRSSSFAFKGRNVDSREVGRQLGVAHILEGSVRKSGDQIRISAQLVKADDGFQLWSETYDRRLDDIFQIQDDIARSVADALELKLLGTRSDASEESLPDTTTYTKTLQAQHLIRSSLSEDLSSARRLLDEALEAEPRYAPAWAALGLFHVYEGAGAADVEAKHRAMEKARSALEKAIEIDPDLPEAHSRLAITYWTLDWDFSAAERSTERALELAPNNPVVMGNAAYLFMVLGRFDDAIELQERSVQRDPLSPITFGNLAGSYEVAGRYGDAVALAEQALTLSPSRDAYETLAGALVELGRYEEAQEAADRLVEVSGLKELGLLFDVQIETRSGNEEGAQAAMRRLETIYCDQSPMLCARARAFRGDKDQAFAWLEHAMEVREPEVTEVKVYREIAPIRDDPRYPVILQKIGLPVG